MQMQCKHFTDAHFLFFFSVATGADCAQYCCCTWCLSLPPPLLLLHLLHQCLTFNLFKFRMLQRMVCMGERHTHTGAGEDWWYGGDGDTLSLIRSVVVRGDGDGKWAAASTWLLDTNGLSFSFRICKARFVSLIRTLLPHVLTYWWSSSWRPLHWPAHLLSSIADTLLLLLPLLASLTGACPFSNALVPLSGLAFVFPSHWVGSFSVRSQPLSPPPLVAHLLAIYYPFPTCAHLTLQTIRWSLEVMCVCAVFASLLASL